MSEHKGDHPETTEPITTSIIKKFFSTSTRNDLRYLMAEMDAMQDAQDTKLGKHIPIQLTVSIFAELIHRAEIKSQRKRDE